VSWGGRYLVEQHGHIMLHYEGLYVGGGEEALLNHVLQLLQQRVKEAARVQQRDGLVVNLELALAQKFRKFFERSEPPCASDNTAAANEVARATTVWGGKVQSRRVREWRNRNIYINGVHLRVARLEYFCLALRHRVCNLSFSNHFPGKLRRHQKFWYPTFDAAALRQHSTGNLQ
jgi:hypothetical protein